MSAHAKRDKHTRPYLCLIMAEKPGMEGSTNVVMPTRVSLTLVSVLISEAMRVIWRRGVEQEDNNALPLNLGAKSEIKRWQSHPGPPLFFSYFTFRA